MSDVNEKKPTVLLVDEDSFLLSIYADRFMDSGWEVDISQSVSDCMEKLRRESPDALILDMMIGEAPGTDVLKKMQEAGLNKNTMTVILTNQADDKAAKEASSLGAHKYLVKAHYSPAEIVQRIEEAYKSFHNK